MSVDGFRRVKAESKKGARLTCQRCGRVAGNGKPMIELSWRTVLNGIRQGQPTSETKYFPINIDFNINCKKPIATTGLLSMDAVEDEIPYDIVCSEVCYNGACVAWFYEDRSTSSASVDETFSSLPERREET